MNYFKNIDAHQKSYVCTHVFNAERPVLLVSREDGDWCFLCGDLHPNDASAYRVVGIGHVLERYEDLIEVLDLKPGQEAERATPGASWIRTGLSPSR